MNDPLRELTNQSVLFIKQRRPKCLELFGCWEYQNKYKLQDGNGQPILEAKEHSDCLMRACCANAREFRMEISNGQGEVILELDRPFNCLAGGWCCMCCYPSCTQALTVNSYGQQLGTVHEIPSWWTKRFSIRNNSDLEVFSISGPCMWLCWDVEFQVLGAGGEDVGSVTKLWKGCAMETFTDMDHFKIEFNQNMSNQDKALLIGAAFLIDFMYFEKTGNE